MDKVWLTQEADREDPSLRPAQAKRDPSTKQAKCVIQDLADDRQEDSGPRLARAKS
jgi:hypothetical protein